MAPEYARFRITISKHVSKEVLETALVSQLCLRDVVFGSQLVRSPSKKHFEDELYETEIELPDSEAEALRTSRRVANVWIEELSSTIVLCFQEMTVTTPTHASCSPAQRLFSKDLRIGGMQESASPSPRVTGLIPQTPLQDANRQEQASISGSTVPNRSPQLSIFSGWGSDAGRALQVSSRHGSQCGTMPDSAAFVSPIASRVQSSRLLDTGSSHPGRFGAGPSPLAADELDDNTSFLVEPMGSARLVSSARSHRQVTDSQLRAPSKPNTPAAIRHAPTPISGAATDPIMHHSPCPQPGAFTFLERPGNLKIPPPEVLSAREDAQSARSRLEFDARLSVADPARTHSMASVQMPLLVDIGTATPNAKRTNFDVDVDTVTPLPVPRNKGKQYSTPSPWATDTSTEKENLRTGSTRHRANNSAVIKLAKKGSGLRTDGPSRFDGPSGRSSVGSETMDLCDCSAFNDVVGQHHAVVMGKSADSFVRAHRHCETECAVQ